MQTSTTESTANSLDFAETPSAALACEMMMMTADAEMNPVITGRAR